MYRRVNIAIMRARIFLCLLAFWGLAMPSLAQMQHSAPSLDRLLPQIRRSNPGTFYDAQGPFVGPNGQAAYRIKWMTPDGRIIWFYVDARSGQMMGAGPVVPLPQSNQFGNPDRFRDGGGWAPGHGWNGGGWGGGDRNGHDGRRGNGHHGD